MAMMLVNSVASLSRSATPWDFIAGTIGVAAGVVSFVASLKSHSFAGGGIVAPATSGDQVHARLNPGEMVLNHAQQRRLFNVIAKENKPENQFGNVEFKLRGQELVGLINNYNRKYN